MLQDNRPFDPNYRDGLTQEDREVPMLDPQVLQWEDRGMQDWLRFAADLGNYIHYYNSQDEQDGYWSDFLNSPPATLGALLQITDPEQLRAAWLEVLSAYGLQALPEAQLAAAREQLTAPHRVLLLTFLRLMEHIKTQFNLLPGRHLDFHFRDILGFEPRPAAPDQVHVRILAEEDALTLLLPQGSLLPAGTDTAGLERYYATDFDLLVNQAQLAAIRTVYLGKNYFTLQFIHLQAISRYKAIEDDYNARLEEARELYLFEETEKAIEEGRPISEIQIPPDEELLPGETRPTPYRTMALDDLVAYALGEGELDNVLSLPEGINHVEELDESNPGHVLYITGQLHLSITEYLRIRDTQTRFQSFSYDFLRFEWDEAYTLLSGSYLTKKRKEREAELRSVYEQSLPAAAPEGIPAPEEVEQAYLAMLRYAFGDPNAGDPLPLYREEEASPYLIARHLKDPNPTGTLSRQAQRYITDNFLMEAVDFQVMHDLAVLQSKSGAQWENLLHILEPAMSRKRNISAAFPVREQIGQLYQSQDPTTELAVLNTDASHQTWTTMGSSKATLAEPGFVLASPMLHLREGERYVRVYLSLDGVTISEEARSWIQELVNDDPEAEAIAPFQISLYNGTDLLPVENVDFASGTYLFGNPGEAWVLSDVNQQEKVAGSTHLFLLTSADDSEREASLDMLYLLPEGHVFLPLSRNVHTGDISMYQLITLAPEQMADWSLQTGFAYAFDKQDLYAEALEINLYFPAAADPILPDPESTLEAMELHITLKKEEANPTESLYALLRGIRLLHLRLEVEATDIPLALAANDLSEIDTQKPYQPFTDNLQQGRTFYFSHPELAAKPIETLGLQFDWQDVPGSFSDYYQGIYDYLANSSDPTKSIANPFAKNEDLQASLWLYDGNRQYPLQADLPLFGYSSPTADSLPSGSLQADITAGLEALSEMPPFTIQTVDEDIIGVQDLARYYMLRYEGPAITDAQWELAQIRYFQQAQEDLSEALPRPFIPQTAAVRLQYKAAISLNPGLSTHTEHINFDHITAFGSTALSDRNSNYLLPLYLNEGELYLGFARASAGDALSLWFQLSEAGVDPDLPASAVTWQYFNGVQWQNIPATKLTLDSTAGLRRTGIIQLQLPDDSSAIANAEAELLHWIRALAPQYAASIPDTIAIYVGGVRATLSGGPYDPSHYQRPLPAFTITQVEPQPADIEGVEQPFSSVTGKAAETDTAMRARVSERIRHKQRALSMWDYEHLVLDQFQDIYKVKCLSADHNQLDEPGVIRVLLIPDIRGQLPFDPMAPKLQTARLEEVQQYLQALAPAFATIQVSNPHYVPVRASFLLRLNPGYGQEQSFWEMQNAIKRFLAPWAFDEGEEITFGGQLYANALAAFVETLPYVDYVAQVKLFTKDESGEYLPITPDDDEEYNLYTTEPDTILVSDEFHDITLITDQGYDYLSYSGINHDQIEVDFRVDINHNTP